MKILYFRNGIESCFQRGNHTLKVPMSLFQNNRKRLIERIKANKKVPDTGTFIILEGGVEIPFNDTDICWPFRQVSKLLTFIYQYFDKYFFYIIFLFIGVIFSMVFWC